MSKLWFVALLLLAMLSAAWADQLIPGSLNGNLLHLGGSLIPGGGGSLPPPPSCTSSLNFSQSCNSQYLGMVGL